MRRFLILIVLLICLGLLMTLYYARALATCEPCVDWHRAIIAGTADSPHRYRILAPFLVETLFVPTTGVLIGYVAAHALTFPVLLVMLFRYWRQWVSVTAALVGVVVVVAYSPIMFGVYGISLATPLEAIWLCLGLLWLLDGRDGLPFALLVIVGTLTRETAILLPLAYAALHLTEWRKPRIALKAAGYFAAWAAVFVGLRLALGPAPHQITVAQVFAANFGGGWNTTEAILNNLFLVPIWALALVGVRGAPVTVKRLALIGLPYAGLLAVFALWNETRLLLPLMVLWFPFALRVLDSPQWRQMVNLPDSG